MTSVIYSLSFNIVFKSTLIETYAYLYKVVGIKVNLLHATKRYLKTNHKFEQRPTMTQTFYYLPFSFASLFENPFFKFSTQLFKIKFRFFANVYRLP